MGKAVRLTTENPAQTRRVGKNLGRTLLAHSRGKQAAVLALSGDLGAGKTTFLQGFAAGLGIKEKILSPTFVLMKRFKIKNGRTKVFKNFYHFDCYRLNNAEEILHLDFRKIISNPENIVAIEWPEKIKKLLPKNVVSIKFMTLEKNKREIIFDQSFLA